MVVGLELLHSLSIPTMVFFIFPYTTSIEGDRFAIEVAKEYANGWNIFGNTDQN